MKQRNFHMAVLVLFVCLLFCIVEQAQAKDDSTAADQDLAQKEGGLGSKEIDASKRQSICNRFPSILNHVSKGDIIP